MYARANGIDMRALLSVRASDTDMYVRANGNSMKMSPHGNIHGRVCQIC